MIFGRQTVPDRPTLSVAERTVGDVNMSDRQLAFIEALTRECPLHRFLEVGVYKGVTTTLLAQIGPVVAVDWFEGNKENSVDGRWNQTAEDFNDRLGGFLGKLDRMGVRGNVTVLTGPSAEVLPLLNNDRFGLVLIDADHSTEAALGDIRNVWDLIVRGGWLVLDDFSIAPLHGTVEGTVCRAWELFRRSRNLRDLPLVTADEGDSPKTVAIRKPE